MKSLRNHFSLILALFAVLLSIQVFNIIERTIAAYEKNLQDNYSIVIVSKTALDLKFLKRSDTIIADITEISPAKVLEKVKKDFKQKNLDQIRSSLPKFYTMKLTKYPSSFELSDLERSLRKISSITKIEDFSKSHDSVHKLLTLFKSVISFLGFIIVAVTALLILKEMRLWQFQHQERMNIMALFGAPIWLRSAVLFRLAIVDAILASILVLVTFFIIDKNGTIETELDLLNINITLFNYVNDFFFLLGVSLATSIILATFIVLGHKEEV